MARTYSYADAVTAVMPGALMPTLKPYVPAFDRPHEEPRAGWLDEVTLTDGITPADLNAGTSSSPSP